MSLLAQLDQKIAANGGLIVSCQPVPDSPLDKPEIVAAMALAAEQAGAVAIRIEGVANLQATRAVVSVPIIGIVKRDLEDSPVRITAYIEDVDALAQAGADIIAIDGTDRPRPVPVETLLARIHHHGLLAMTDCSTPEEPDLALVKTLSDAGCRVIAEGRYNTPAQAADAMRHGAWAVTVGSAITRLEHICQWYNTAMKKAVL
ncbi:N-acetylmannosamine-6-phosphate 2-epimerase [Escherichia coli]|uniref:N-acetylmannosamine-6-phosphate 2-epimerase n=1 Tax=Escherichia coli TaxID=562 RepID=UPI0002A20F37|nr:putative N-acetylmannosamine-6-phosphate 2-epimerase [Escherichia coli]ELF89979.1 N-acetylmannosamine-6-P epimerase [Escherichia coli KTE22]MCN3203628.1 putative N-acetylmannosamine-6-phosphate 2-epimerase [Escherichia coli]